MAYIVGTEGIDQYRDIGTSGDDVISGKGGYDHVGGSYGDDILFGDGGDDTFYVTAGQGTDTIYGGDGDKDKLELTHASNGVFDVSLGSITGVEKFEITSWKNLTILSDGMTDISDFKEFSSVYNASHGDAYGNYLGIEGGAGADTIIGFNLTNPDAWDNIKGGGGNDAIWGEAGNDTLYGEDGDDKLAGGAGDDTLSGGAGSDEFRFSLGDDSDTDVITDFEDDVDLISFWFSNGAAFEDLAIASANGGADTHVSYTGSYLGEAAELDLTLQGVDSTLIDATDFTFG